jgi:hypothetical protein
MKSRLMVVVSMIAFFGYGVQTLASSGAGGTTTFAFYDCDLHKINLFPLPNGTVQEANTQINKIFECAANDSVCNGILPHHVLDAIHPSGRPEETPANGFNPVWEKWLITILDPTLTLDDLCSDDRIFAAQANNRIALTDTDEFFICAVLH